MCTADAPLDRSLARLPRLLRQWRLHQSLKAADAATRLGVAAATWGHWETGKRFPSSENLVLITRLTGIPIQYFFCPHADACPVSVSTSEQNHTKPRVCGACGGPLYQE